jgi:hypothetical protein
LNWRLTKYDGCGIPGFFICSYRQMKKYLGCESARDADTIGICRSIDRCGCMRAWTIRIMMHPTPKWGDGREAGNQRHTCRTLMTTTVQLIKGYARRRWYLTLMLSRLGLGPYICRYLGFQRVPLVNGRPSRRPITLVEKSPSISVCKAH